MSQKTKYIPFRCSPRLHAKLEIVAQAQEISVSEVIRLACEHYCSNVTLPAMPIMGELSGKGTDWSSIHAKLAVVLASEQEKAA